MKLQENQIFYSQIIGKDTKILIKKVDTLNNELSVKVKGKLEVWNLEEAIWSFEKGECITIGFK